MQLDKPNKEHYEPSLDEDDKEFSHSLYKEGRKKGQKAKFR